MVYIGKKELNSRHFAAAVLVLLIAALCILKIGGLTATITIIIYCILLGLTFLSILDQIFNSTTVSMRIGMVADPKTGHVSLDMNIYDQFIKTYEHRFSSIWFWMDIPITMAWVAVFLSSGHFLIAYIVIAAYMGIEVGRYEIYKTIKRNKDAWGAAMYVDKVKDFVSKKEENNK